MTTWKGSCPRTRRRRAPRLRPSAFPHTPPAGDQIPTGRPSRKPWWTWEQTTSSWSALRLPSTSTLLMPSKKPPLFFYSACPTFDFNICRDVEGLTLKRQMFFLCCCLTSFPPSGPGAPTHTCSRSPAVWLASPSHTPAGWEPTTPMTFSTSSGSHLPRLWDTGHVTGTSPATWSPTGPTLPKPGMIRTS